MRKLLRKIILWALAAEPLPPHDAAGMDRIASEQKRP